MKQISIRLTDAEYDVLSTQAARVGMSPTGYLREIAQEESDPDAGQWYADLVIDRREMASTVRRVILPSDDSL